MLQGGAENTGTLATGKAPDPNEAAPFHRPGGKPRVTVKGVENDRPQLGPGIKLPGEVFLSIALMNDQWEIGGDGDLNLPLEGALLLTEGGAGPGKVEPGLTNGQRPQREKLLGERVGLRGAEAPCVLGVKTRRQLDTWVGGTEGDRLLPNIWPVGDIQDVLYSRCAPTFYDLSPINVKSGIVEVSMGVENWRQGIAHLTVTLLARLRGRSGSFPRASAA